MFIKETKDILQKKIFKKIFTFGWIPAFVLLLANTAHAQMDGNMASMATILYFILSMVVKIISGLATAFDIVLWIGVTNASGVTDIEVVRNTWTLVRNFSNMFFIIGLIIMAFATIFDVSKYNFRAMIVRFLIIALLINFSLTIGETIIDWTQSLSGVFLTAMGSFGNILGGPLDPAILLGEAEQGTAGSLRPFLASLCGAIGGDIAGGACTAATVWGTYAIDGVGMAQLGQMFFSIILGSIIAFSLLVGLIFTAVRIPILWGLLILAPAAWVCSIFPPLADSNRRWWKYFLGWNFFLPIYLFFLYIGLVFMQNQNTILRPDVAQKFIPGIGFSFQILFFYAFVGMFMIYGVKFAMSGGFAAGAGGVAGAIWAKSRATARASTIGLAGYGFRATGIPGAYKDTKEHIQKEGFVGTPLENIPIIGGYKGKRGLEERQAAIAGALGVPGASEKLTQKRIQAAEEKYKRAGYDAERLNNFITPGNPEEARTPEERIAAANVIKQYRDLRGSEVKRLYDEYKKLSPSEAAKWIRNQKGAIEGLGKTDLDELEKTADPQMQQFIARIKAKRDLISGTDAWEERLELFRDDRGGSDAAMASFVGESKEFIDRLEMDDALKVFNKILPANREAKKKFAQLIASKGFLDTDTLKGLTGPGGVFESDSEKEKFLDLAKEGDLVSALEAKLSAGVLRDLKTKQLTNDIDLVLEQEYSRMTPKAIASQKLRVDTANPSRSTGLANDRALAALERSLDNSRPERLADFYRSDEYTSNIPVRDRVEPVLKKMRDKALKKDKLDPLNTALQKLLKTSIPAIKSAKDSRDNILAETATREAQGLYNTAERLVRSITLDTSFADESTKTESERKITEAKAELEGAKKYTPQRRP